MSHHGSYSAPDMMSSEMMSSQMMSSMMMSSTMMSSEMMSSEAPHSYHNPWSAPIEDYNYSHPQQP